MGLSGVYNDPVSEEVGISILKHAFNRGITFFDTSDVYGPHTNEVLLGKVSVIPISIFQDGLQHMFSFLFRILTKLKNEI